MEDYWEKYKDDWDKNETKLGKSDQVEMDDNHIFEVKLRAKPSDVPGTYLFMWQVHKDNKPIGEPIDMFFIIVKP